MSPLRPAAAAALSWYQSLQTRLGGLFLLLLLVLGAVALYASRQLIGNGLAEGNYRYEDSVSHRIAAQVQLPTASAEALAEAIVVQAQNHPQRAQLKTAMVQLAERLPNHSLVAALGVWPEPGTLESGVERASIYLLRDANGHLQPREEYNDPRSIPYFREPWYTPARYALSDRCFWTVSYRDLLAKRELVTCVIPLAGSGFAGAATVSLDVAALVKYFADATADASGYAILLDRDNRLLALSARAQSLASVVGPGRGVAELAQHMPAFNPLALALNRQRQDFLAGAVRSAHYDASVVSSLQKASRDMSRAEAESVLAAIWNSSDGGAPPAGEQMELPKDALLGTTGYTVLRALPGTQWRIASVTGAREGEDGARYLVSQALVLTLGAAALTLALAWGVIRRSVVRPLRRMTRALAQAASGDDALEVALDQSPRNELGLIAHWYNERTSQLRTQVESGRVVEAQLRSETGERRRAQDALIRMHERTSQALSLVREGIVATDARGLIEDMNAVAEQIAGTSLLAARGQAFAQVFKFRTEEAGRTQLANLPKVAMERGARIEHPDQVTAISARGESTLVSLIAVPLRTRSGGDLGCIVVLCEIRHSQAALPSSVSAPARPELADAPKTLAARDLSDSAKAEDAIWVPRILRGLTDNLFHLSSQWIEPAREHSADGEAYDIQLQLEDEEGFWAPAKAFLAAAERNGLGSQLDRWAVQYTLDALESRTNAQPRIALCNISLCGASIADPTLLDFIAEQVNHRPQFDLARLCFSLPDEILASHPRQAQVFCESMRTFGCTTAIPYQSGSHASEIALLRRVPANFLRFDARQLPNLSGDDVARMIAEGAMRIAHHLGRRMIVMGVERSADVDAWRELGADYLQGDALARTSPMLFAAAS